MIEPKILLMAVAALFFAEIATTVVITEAAYSAMPIIGVARLLEIGILFLIVSIFGKGVSSIGLAPQQLLNGLKRGMIWSAIFGLCAFTGFAVLWAAHINPLNMIKTHMPSGALDRVLFFVVGGLIAPVAEEVFFRGIVFGFLRRWGAWIAVVGTTAFFAIAHPLGPGLPITQIIGGMVFALAYEVEGALMAPITIHILGNMAIFSLSLVA